MALRNVQITFLLFCNSLLHQGELNFCAFNELQGLRLSKEEAVLSLSLLCFPSPLFYAFVETGEICCKMPPFIT